MGPNSSDCRVNQRRLPGADASAAAFDQRCDASLPRRWTVRSRRTQTGPPTVGTSLTAAAPDVLRLSAKGWLTTTSPTRLFVSPRAVRSHLTHVHTRLASAPGCSSPRKRPATLERRRHNVGVHQGQVPVASACRSRVTIDPGRRSITQNPPTDRFRLEYLRLLTTVDRNSRLSLNRHRPAQISIECVDDLASHVLDLPAHVRLDWHVVRRGDLHRGGDHPGFFDLPLGVEFIAQPARGRVVRKY